MTRHHSGQLGLRSQLQLLRRLPEQLPYSQLPAPLSMPEV